MAALSRLDMLQGSLDNTSFIAFLLVKGAALSTLMSWPVLGDSALLGVRSHNDVYTRGNRLLTLVLASMFAPLSSKACMLAT